MCNHILLLGNSSLLQIPLHIAVLAMDKVQDPYTWTISTALDKSLLYWTVGTTKMI